MTFEAKKRSRPVIFQRSRHHAQAARERGRRDALVGIRATLVSAMRTSMASPRSASLTGRRRATGFKQYHEDRSPKRVGFVAFTSFSRYRYRRKSRGFQNGNSN